jgi:hypothetical protein
MGRDTSDGPQIPEQSRDLERRGLVMWLLVWAGRALIFVFTCALVLVTLGATWRWPFIMLVLWYWFEYQVRQVRRELRIARKTAASDCEAVQLAERALVGRGFMVPSE